MLLRLKWYCDDCGSAKTEEHVYDWKVGLCDVWHPECFKGIGAKILCPRCYEKEWIALAEKEKGVWMA